MILVAKVDSVYVTRFCKVHVGDKLIPPFYFSFRENYKVYYEEIDSSIGRALSIWREI